MPLLSLPLETFREILDHAVIAVGARGAARLRAVNSEFCPRAARCNRSLLKVRQGYLPARFSRHWIEQAGLKSSGDHTVALAMIPPFPPVTRCERTVHSCLSLLGTW